MFRAVGPTGYERSYDKELNRNTVLRVDFVLCVEDNKVVFPRDDKLEMCLLQQFLNVQMCVAPAANFTLEFVITDSTKVPSRRLIDEAKDHLLQRSQQAGGETIPPAFFEPCVPVGLLDHCLLQPEPHRVPIQGEPVHQPGKYHRFGDLQASKDIHN